VLADRCFLEGQHHAGITRLEQRGEQMPDEMINRVECLNQRWDETEGDN
jgi:hypothetical protein